MKSATADSPTSSFTSIGWRRGRQGGRRFLRCPRSGWRCKGRVGLAMEGTRSAEAIRKATEAKRGLIRVPLREGRTLHLMLPDAMARTACFCAAPPGTSIIARTDARYIRDARDTGRGGQVSLLNPYNMVRATFDALKRRDSPRSVASRRNIKVSMLRARRRSRARPSRSPIDPQHRRGKVSKMTSCSKSTRRHRSAVIIRSADSDWAWPQPHRAVAHVPDTRTRRCYESNLVRVLETERWAHELCDRPGTEAPAYRPQHWFRHGQDQNRSGKSQTTRSGVHQGVRRRPNAAAPRPLAWVPAAAFARRLNEINNGVQAAIEAGKLDPAATVDVGALVKAGVLRRAKDGVRLLGSGEIKTKVAFSVWGASKSAVAAVERAGGSVSVLAPKPGTGEQRG